MATEGSFKNRTDTIFTLNIWTPKFLRILVLNLNNANLLDADV